MVDSLTVNGLLRPVFTVSCSASFVQFGGTATAAVDSAGAGALLVAVTDDAARLIVVWGDAAAADDAAGADDDEGGAGDDPAHAARHSPSATARTTAGRPRRDRGIGSNSRFERSRRNKTAGDPCVSTPAWFH